MNSTTLKLQRTGKIVLLFTLIGVSQLYGMEPEKGNQGSFEQLPKELHQIIVEMLITKKDPIAALKLAQVLRGAKYDNLKDFTRLIHTIANAFDAPTEYIASQIDTPVAKQYVQLSTGLINAIKNYHPTTGIEEIKQLIANGADVNYSTDITAVPGYVLQGVLTPLFYGIIYGNFELMKVLLDAGANPNVEFFLYPTEEYEDDDYIHIFEGTIKEYVRDHLMGDRQYKEKMYQLLDEAAQKQAQLK